jgi:hypothetical protein
MKKKIRIILEKIFFKKKTKKNELIHYGSIKKQFKKYREHSNTRFRTLDRWVMSPAR